MAEWLRARLESGRHGIKHKLPRHGDNGEEGEGEGEGGEEGGPSRDTLVTFKLVLQYLPCQARGGIVSALGLVGPVSVYCNWLR